MALGSLGFSSFTTSRHRRPSPHSGVLAPVRPLWRDADRGDDINTTPEPRRTRAHVQFDRGDTGTQLLTVAVESLVRRARFHGIHVVEFNLRIRRASLTILDHSARTRLRRESAGRQVSVEAAHGFGLRRRNPCSDHLTTVELGIPTGKVSLT
jgi:hypothetical protein